MFSFELENAECTCECEFHNITNKKIYTFPDGFIQKSLNLMFDVKYIDKEFFKIESE